MIIQNFILSLVVQILASLLAEPLSRLLRLPFVAILIVVGYFGSEMVVSFGYDTGIRASNFPLLVFYVFLPIIIFESAYKIDQKLLLKSLYPIIILSLPIMMIAVVLWGGSRGAVTAALALSLPTEVEGWWTIQSMAFGVIIFTQFVQAPTIPLILKKFNKSKKQLIMSNKKFSYNFIYFFCLT